MSVKYLRSTHFHLGAFGKPNLNPIALFVRAGDKCKEDLAGLMEGAGGCRGVLLQLVTVGITRSDPLETRGNSPEDTESNVKHFSK